MSDHVALHHKIVRDRSVRFKAPEGLRPVDVILRDVSDGFRDSPAIPGDSLLGVPGLVEAARGVPVSVAKALGSGLVRAANFVIVKSQVTPLLSGARYRCALKSGRRLQE